MKRTTFYKAAIAFCFLWVFLTAAFFGTADCLDDWIREIAQSMNAFAAGTLACQTAGDLGRFSDR